MHQSPCLPMTALAIAAVSLTLNASIADTARPRAVCTAITNVNQLQAMKNNLAGNYCLANDIDASAKPNFAPVGSPSTPFTGTLNGNGHVISNLTIKSAQQYIGLFGVTSAAVIGNLTLLNVNVRGTPGSAVAFVGALAGHAYADAPDSTTIANVHVSGQVRCLTDNCDVGGIFGAFGSFTGTKTLRNSSSSADVIGTRFVGGAVGLADHVTVRRTYATGAVRCTALNCMAAGLVGRLTSSTVVLTFATGAVTAADGSDSRTGGLIGYVEATSTVSRSFAAGPVSGGASGMAAGLIAQLNGGSADQLYSVGPVSSTGATVAGLIADVAGGVPVTNSYWDTSTSGQALSAAGTGQTTAQLRAALPTGFGIPWGITQALSYPFFTVPDIDFAAPLATLVRSNKVFTFLPISQHDESQYLTPPANTELTALATVYTMIARAIGIAQSVPRLTNVAIDRYFWDEAAQKARFRGPVKTYATLGTLTAIASGTPIDVANVIGAMDSEQLVILRGRYSKDGGGSATHWMLGTLYRKDGGGNPTAVIAHDPWTGQQVTIDPATKKVVTPADFPLTNFKVNAYQPVTVN